jgi:hypothetical protein
MVAKAPAFSPETEALARAFERAVAEKIVVYRVANPTMLGVASVVNGWTLKPYTITITGEQPQDVTCDCASGQHGRACKHRAVAIFARQHHVYAQRPAPACDRLTVEAFN